ncbi:hypothetical protein JTE90_018584 [Oedothorax gibbosus]|uniref:Uncharacterized protein n=1 Tax=Oedothorax gibbosus TaxID=931172 RepID=A0AAV6U376_9ARAC|nr:hypothetical protein JTE90_018584 [Oedothorax gibbosus]
MTNSAIAKFHIIIHIADSTAFRYASTKRADLKMIYRRAQKGSPQIADDPATKKKNTGLEKTPQVVVRSPPR